MIGWLVGEGARMGVAVPLHDMGHALLKPNAAGQVA